MSQPDTQKVLDRDHLARMTLGDAPLAREGAYWRLDARFNFQSQAWEADSIKCDPATRQWGAGYAPYNDVPVNASSVTWLLAYRP